MRYNHRQLRTTGVLIGYWPADVTAASRPWADIRADIWQLTFRAITVDECGSTVTLRTNQHITFLFSSPQAG